MVVRGASGGRLGLQLTLTGEKCINVLKALGVDYPVFDNSAKLCHRRFVFGLSSALHFDVFDSRASGSHNLLMVENFEIQALDLLILCLV